MLISVSDTDAGLPEGRADEIFNAFFTTKPQGSGMGLVPSWMRMVAVYGPRPTLDEARRFISPCRSLSWKYLR